MKDSKTLTTFPELGLDARLLKALEAEGYTTPTPIQAQAIPPCWRARPARHRPDRHRQDRRLRAADPASPGCRTAARAPRKGCRVLVLSPTRELATQIAESFRTYGRHMGLTVAVVFGGVGHRPQIQAMARGVDVLVATPGRLLDHIAERSLSLRGHRDLRARRGRPDAGPGLHASRSAASSAQLPHKRQNLFFSATMPREIGKLADELLHDPGQGVAWRPRPPRSSASTQRVIHVEASKKRALLVELFADPELSRALVFTRTKRGADRVAEHLEAAGIAVAAIHGNKSQGQREQALAAFRKARIRVLVATDIAARGIDVDGVTPRRELRAAGRAGKLRPPHRPHGARRRRGQSPSRSCDGEERDQLRDIERLTRQSIPAEDRRQDAGLTADRGGRPHRGRPGQDRGGRRYGSGEPSRHRSGANGRNGPRNGARDRSDQNNGWRARDTERNGPSAERREGARGDRNQPRDRREATQGDRPQSRDRHEPREGARANGERSHNGHGHRQSDRQGASHRSNSRPHSDGANGNGHRNHSDRNGAERRGERSSNSNPAAGMAGVGFMAKRPGGGKGGHHGLRRQGGDARQSGKR